MAMMLFAHHPQSTCYLQWRSFHPFYPISVCSTSLCTSKIEHLMWQNRQYYLCSPTVQWPSHYGLGHCLEVEQVVILPVSSISGIEKLNSSPSCQSLLCNAQISAFQKIQMNIRTTIMNFKLNQMWIIGVYCLIEGPEFQKGWVPTLATPYTLYFRSESSPAKFEHARLKRTPAHSQ